MRIPYEVACQLSEQLFKELILDRQMCISPYEIKRSLAKIDDELTKLGWSTKLIADEAENRARAQLEAAIAADQGRVFPEEQ